LQENKNLGCSYIENRWKYESKPLRIYPGVNIALNVLQNAKYLLLYHHNRLAIFESREKMVNEKKSIVKAEKRC